MLSAPTLAAQDLDGDFSNVEVGEQTELVEGAEVLEEAVIEETEISEEFVADETPLSDIDEASGEMATGDNVDQIEEKEADDVSPEVPSDESGPTEEQVYISKVTVRTARSLSRFIILAMILSWKGLIYIEDILMVMTISYSLSFQFLAFC